MVLLVVVMVVAVVVVDIDNVLVVVMVVEAVVVKVTRGSTVSGLLSPVRPVAETDMAQIPGASS